MTRLNNGMLGYQALEEHTMKVYDFYIDEGILKKLHCYDYQTRETTFEDIYDPLKNQMISREHFEEAFEIFCNNYGCDQVISFFEHLENDGESREIAKEVLYECSYRAAKIAQELIKAVCELERKK